MAEHTRQLAVKSTGRWRLIGCYVGFALLTLGLAPAVGKTISERTIDQTRGPWNRADLWSNGVPNGIGDEATLTVAPAATVLVTMGESITLERLDIVSNASEFTLVGQDPLVFAADAEGEPTLLLAPVTGASPLLQVQPRVVNPTTGDFIVNVAADSRVDFDGGFASPQGALVKRGAGELMLNGSVAWRDGIGLIVEEGAVVAESEAVLAEGMVAVTSGGTLVLPFSSDASVALDGGTLQTAYGRYTGPITIASESTISRPTNPIGSGNYEIVRGPTEFSGTITGAGDLIIENASRDELHLSGANSYQGHTYINAGRAVVLSAEGLGSASQGTTVRGGTLDLREATADSIRVEDGILVITTSHSTPASSIVLERGKVFLPDIPVIEFPVLLDGDEGTVSGRNYTTSFRGGIHGAGDLRLEGIVNVDAPLTHDGATTFAMSGAVNVANTYTGATKIDGSVTLNHADGFAGTETIRVAGGELALNAMPAGTPDIAVERGTLYFPNDGQAVSNRLTLGRNEGSAALKGNATYVTPVTIADDARDVAIQGGVFNAPIVGTGPLTIANDQYDVVLNVANPELRSVEIEGGRVHANVAGAIPEYGTFVTGGTLHANAPLQQYVLANQRQTYPTRPGTISLDSPQSLSLWVAYSGQLDVNASASFDDMISVGASNITISDAGVLEIGESYHPRFGGTIGSAPFELGSITGNGTITSTSRAFGVDADMSGFTGDIVVKNGILGLSDSASSSLNGNEIHVYEHATLKLGTSNDSQHEVYADIFLHNTHGDSSELGALKHSYYASDATFYGRIDVGDQGSTTIGNFVVAGRLTGNNLTHRYSQMGIASPQTELGGVLRVHGGGLAIMEGGSLGGAVELLLDRGGGLYLLASETGDGDRVADDLLIRSRGGSIRNYHQPNGEGGETLGSVRLERGVTSLLASGTGYLTVTNLERAPGAILQFDLPGSSEAVRLPNESNRYGAMLAPWAIVDQGFASVSADGQRIETLIGEQILLNDASPSSHVVMSQDSQTLTRDVSVASLNGALFGSTIDLNGHLLALESGGLFRAPFIDGGRLTAGRGEDAELIVHYGDEIRADIIDHPDGGSVSLVVNEGTLWLWGNHGYSGGTWIVGDSSNSTVLRPRSLSAIPQGDRVYVDGGDYDLTYLPFGVVELEELHLRDGGDVGSAITDLQIDRLFLEDGRFQAPLVGAGEIIKTTRGTVEMRSFSSPDFTGNVLVQDGVLKVDQDALPNSTYFVDGGELSLLGQGVDENQIVLRGGTLNDGTYWGFVNVEEDSTLAHLGQLQMFGTLRGTGDLTIRGRNAEYADDFVALLGDGADYHGDIAVESGALKIGQANAAGDASITVASAGRLILGVRYDHQPTLVVANDIVLDGGMLYSVPVGSTSRRVASIATGLITVNGDAVIGSSAHGYLDGIHSAGLTLAGSVVLSDESRVFGVTNETGSIAGTLPPHRTEITGELLVGVNTQWHLLTASLGITGTIRGSSERSSIDFIGLPDLLDLEGVTIIAEAGRSLTATINSGKFPLPIYGDHAALTGDGELVGDFTLSAGAKVAPGASTGRLEVRGDLTFADESSLLVEIAGTVADAEYDLLAVDGVVDVATGNLVVELLDGFHPAVDDSFLVLTADSIVGQFANAVDSVRAGLYRFDVIYGDQQVELTGARLAGDFDENLVVDGSDFLTWQTMSDRDAIDDWQENYGTALSGTAQGTVPEPHSALLAAAASCCFLSRRLRRGRRITEVRSEQRQQRISTKNK